jgi:tetratricopeptide (TPR) repeat protein
MKTLSKILLSLTITLYSFTVAAQESNDPKSLVKQGVGLNDAGKYAEAIAKYNEALKIDSTFQSAYYEIAYTLFSSGKANEAIPYLEKLLKLDPKSAGAYDMLGSIYDDNKQPEKAIDYYLKGIKANPGYQRLYFNMAITYYKMGKYEDSEKYAIQAIKMDTKHASSQRIYAMATYAEGKRGVSLLAWCSFLLIEPQTKRSEEANRYVQNILNYGITRSNEKTVNINVNPKEMGGSNLMMQLAVLAATSDKKGLTKTDSLTLQLKRVFEISESFAGKKEDPFYKSYLSDYFKGLAASDNMPAFARFISISVNREENLQWFKDNDSKISALDNWVANTKRQL